MGICSPIIKVEFNKNANVHRMRMNHPILTLTSVGKSTKKRNAEKFANKRRISLASVLTLNDFY